MGAGCRLSDNNCVTQTLCWSDVHCLPQQHLARVGFGLKKQNASPLSDVGQVRTEKREPSCVQVLERGADERQRRSGERQSREEKSVTGIRKTERKEKGARACQSC